ncbi:recombinase family protein [Amycolatopsis nigrescens]|uniref:recombinase family protein n=1 Tax=Amycolatopsis nigrescens TaxID=381445 RepID=UPI000A012D70|nr:recombinase family protein [Amycolatopsis nigrescens]
MNNATSSSLYVENPLLNGAHPGTGRATVLYLRVSSTRQVGRDYDPEGISIPAQREACRRKAEQLGLTIVGEYVEPGRSALEMSKRTAFQRMLARIRHAGDVDHVIVYKLSRMARNRVDDALIMADLRQRGVSLISATESVDDTPVGQLMHGILATFNEYQSRESGADIAYKMGQKARNGGTIGRARLGYLNHIDRTDGRDIRTIMVDPERAPLVQLGFELFAIGNFTLDQLSQRLYERGLRTRPTARYPAQRVSISKLARMLRDRYYLGYVTYRGEEVLGRHKPLVDQFLFDRVQAVFDARTTSGERRRTHHHYLKGTLYCGHCHQAGVAGRMIIQHTITRRRDEYTYFFCRNRQQGNCPAPYVNVAIAEHAVERYYTTVSHQQVADAVARLATGDIASNELGQALPPVQIYRICNDDQRQQLNHAIFCRLYLADGRITNHEPRSAAP